MSAVDVALIGLPLVAGLQRFSVEYGYAGKPRRVAVREAVGAATMLALIEIVCCMWGCVHV